jgi:N utilization substance protein B
MKTSSDPRHKKRVQLVKDLFAHSFHDSPKASIASILAALPDLDVSIASAAPEWPLSKINRLDLAVLRVATHELSEGNTPAKVVIDEAVEIAKEFGSDSSPGFVNGVLGTIYEKQLKGKS